MSRRKDQDRPRKLTDEREAVISKDEIEERIDAMNEDKEQKLAARREDDLNRQRELDKD